MSSIKLAFKNVGKSIRDYAIYFLTLALGVCIFYVFNSMDSQALLTGLSMAQGGVLEMLVTAINATSVFVSAILAFLIVYANKFLMRRRKKELGVYLYSAEELCYYIVNYVLLLPQDFFNENLYRFVGNELRRPKLEGKLRKWLSQTPDLYQGLLVLLQDIHFYNEEELAQFKQKLDDLRKAGPLELLKKKGDFFLDVRQYGNALRTYDRLLGERGADASFMARVWHNRGVACVQMMQFEEAMDSLFRSWQTLKLESIAREMFTLYCLEPGLSLPEEAAESVSGELQYRWKEEIDAFAKNAAYMGKAEEIAEAFDKDVIRRREEIRALLCRWKQEYREMAG